MPVAPFGNLPLSSDSLYSSRIQTFIEDTPARNYPFVAYKPGYALQASELNELQEQFYLQNTLSNSCLNTWLSTGYSSYPAPFWAGTTPYSPSNISISQSGPNIVATLTAGWFYLVDTQTSQSPLNSGFGFWMRTATNLQVSMSSGDANAITFTNYGLTYTKTVITPSEDADLFDNSNATFVSSTIIGANRIKYSNFLFQKSSGQANFSTIFGIKRTSSNQYILNWPYRNYSQTFYTANH